MPHDLKNNFTLQKIGSSNTSASRMNNKVKKFIYVCILLSAWMYAPAQKQGQPLVDSLLAALPEMKEDTNGVLLLSQLSKAFYTIDPDMGIGYGQQGLILGKKLGYERGLASMNNSMAANFYMKSDYPQAIYFFEKSAFLYKKLGDKKGTASALGNMAIIFQRQSNFAKSLEYHFLALKMNEEAGSQSSIATNLQNIGILYYSLHDFKKALSYYQKAVAIFEKLKNNSGLAGNYTNISNVYAAMKQHDQAIEYVLKAMELYDKTGDKANMATCLGNLGNRYFEKGDVLKAFENIFSALRINESIGNKNGSGVNYGNVGSLYFFVATDTTAETPLPDSLKNRKAMLKKAEAYFTEAIAIAKQIGDLDMMQNNYMDLSEAQTAMGEHGAALASYKKSVVISDSIFSQESKNKLLDLEKQREENLQQKEMEIQRLKLVKAENERYYFIIGFVLLGLLLLVLLNRFRVKKRSSEQLEKAYHDLKATQQQLIHQEKMASLGALTAGIAHEIKNPLNFVNNFSEVSAEQVDELIAAEDTAEKNEIARGLRMNLEKISQHGKRADSIVQSMLQHARHGEAEAGLTDINKLCNEIADLALHGMQANLPGFHADVVKVFDPALQPVKAVSQNISRVLVNLLNNAFYALNEKCISDKKNGSVFRPAVMITTRQVDKTVQISIRDNGTGIPDGTRQKIFEPFFTTKPSGEGTGLGLSICYDIIKAHGGNLSVDSVLNEYTEFVISLPA